MPHATSKSTTDTRYGFTPQVAEHLFSSHADLRKIDAAAADTKAGDPHTRSAVAQTATAAPALSVPAPRSGDTGS